MRICIVTPAPRRARNGNRVTALRYAVLLRSLGHHVAVRERWEGEACDALIALHAVKSAASVRRFRAERRRAPVVVVLAGTDVHGDTPAELDRVLAAATRIVALQPLAIDAISPRFHDVARVVYQSATATATASAPASRAAAFEVCVIAHLREVKDPLLPARALRLLPAASPVRITHAGAALDAVLQRAAVAEMADNPRWRWLGGRSHREIGALLAASHLLVLPSRDEGGANVASEAIAAGLPILATRVSGNVGVLGLDYPGFFPPGDSTALAALLDRAAASPEFLNELRAAVAALRGQVAPAAERHAWMRLLHEVVPPPSPAAGRLEVIGSDVDARHDDLAAATRAGLTARLKSLPCRFFYDDEGSRLFERISELPEYYLTRTEEGILRDHAAAIVADLQPHAAIVELGSGCCAKTRILLEAGLRRTSPLLYVPIDISRATLTASATALLADYPGLTIRAITAEYEEGLRRLAAAELGARPKLVLWLGSNIGNFDRPEAAAFLRRLGAAMRPTDRLLVGIDLRKERAMLERAYADARGVTARFNQNLLHRLNRELNANFAVDAFRHRAVYDEAAGRIEMYLVSQRAQRVALTTLGLEVAFAAGETLHTENSYKYSAAEIAELVSAAGLSIVRSLQDARGWFRVVLLALA